MQPARSRSTQRRSTTDWEIRVTSVLKPKMDKQLYIKALLLFGADRHEEEIRARLAELKGDSSRKARAERKKLKASLEAGNVFRQRLGVPDVLKSF